MRGAPLGEWLVAGLLILLTHVAFVTLERWVPAPGLQLAPESLGREPELWSRQLGENGAFGRESGALVLRNPAGESGVEAFYEFELPGRPLGIRLTADVAVIGVVQGEKHWYKGRVFLARRDASGAFDWRRPHGLMSRVGTTEALRYAKLFEIAPDATHARLAMTLHGAAGELRVERLRLEVLEPSRLHQAIAPVLAISWGAFGLWCAWRSASGMPRRWLLAAAGMAAALAIGAYAPENLTFALTNRLAGWLDDPALAPPQIGDWGHAIGFALLGAFAPFARPRDRAWVQFASLVMLAAASEATQHFTAGRTPLLGDFFYDLGGLTLGFAIARALRGSAAARLHQRVLRQ